MPHLPLQVPHRQYYNTTSLKIRPYNYLERFLSLIFTYLRLSFSTTRNHGYQIDGIAILKDWFIQLTYIPAIEQDVTALPDRLHPLDASVSELMLIQGIVISLNIIPDFPNALCLHRYCLYTQEKPPQPDEFDINTGQDCSSRILV
jgi:hypothetical protein